MYLSWAHQILALFRFIRNTHFYGRVTVTPQWAPVRMRVAEVVLKMETLATHGRWLTILFPTDVH